MKLREALKSVDGAVYCGSASSYWYIGKDAQKAARGINTASEDYRHRFEILLKRTNTEIARYTHEIAEKEESLSGLYGKERKDTEKTIRKRKQELEYARQRKVRYDAVLNPWIPFLGREVTDTYRLTTADGTAIIVEGIELGEYWDMDEWEARHEWKKRRKRKRV